jgi:hypothetical protein
MIKSMQMDTLKCHTIDASVKAVGDDRNAIS